MDVNLEPLPLQAGIGSITEEQHVSPMNHYFSRKQVVNRTFGAHTMQTANESNLASLTENSLRDGRVHYR